MAAPVWLQLGTLMNPQGIIFKEQLGVLVNT